VARGRVIGSPRGLPPRAPTDPDVPDEGIRLFGAWVRDARPAGRRAGDRGWWRRICAIRSHVTFAFCERRSSHVRQTFTTWSRRRARACALPRLPKYPTCPRRRGLPGSWTTLAYVPWSPTPGGPWRIDLLRAGRPTLYHRGVAFRLTYAVGAHRRGCFRGSIARPLRSRSTLRSHGDPFLSTATHDALPAGEVALAGQDVNLLGCFGRVRWCLASIASSSPRLVLAHR
jgi:hypothetical protein